LEFFSREYAEYNDSCGQRNRFNSKTMTQEVFALLSPRAQHAASGLVAVGTIPRGLKDNFVRPQGAAFRELVASRLDGLQIGESKPIPGNSFECRQIRELSEARGFACSVHREGKSCTAWVTRMF